MERLTKRINGYAHGAEGVTEEELTGNYCRGEFEATACVEKLAEYEDLEEQGLLLRLPCKYNDSLYWVFDGFVREVWFKGIRCDKGYEPQIIARFIDGSTLEAKEKPIAKLENIGKTLFFTKEEAEQVLAKMKEV